MFISLPAPRLSASAFPVKRRSPLTPPSVTPPSVTVSDPAAMQRARDRCRSPSSRASALLAKVAVVSSAPGTVPSSPRLCAANSPDSTNSTPPDDGGQFQFSSSKQLPESPDGGYVSFPMFEAFENYGQDHDDGSISPSHR
ncbi:hypothetical protein K440DRAFT_543760 [Wilcoxina mikolae CBS 423.85]|nr:hypothetical protein K440DRAFT_543760 [Wilcoxina mikolae CBS 423.85]